MGVDGGAGRGEDAPVAVLSASSDGVHNTDKWECKIPRASTQGE